MALSIDFSSLPMAVPVAFRVMINYLLSVGVPVAFRVMINYLLSVGVPVAFRVKINYLLSVGVPVALTIDVCRVKKNRKRPERHTAHGNVFDQGPGRKGQRLGDYAEERVVPNGKKMGASRFLPQ